MCALNQQVGEAVAEFLTEPCVNSLTHHIEATGNLLHPGDRKRNQVVFEALFVPINSDQVDELLDRAQCTNQVYEAESGSYGARASAICCS